MDHPSVSNEELNIHFLSRLVLPLAPGLAERGGIDQPPGMLIQERVDTAEATLLRRAETIAEVDSETVRGLVRLGKTGLHKLAGEGAGASLTTDERLGLEAVGAVDGSRPVLFVQDGTIDLDALDPDNVLERPWRGRAEARLAGIERIAGSVGSICLPAFGNRQIGTGFAIAPGLILTNRHVLEVIATHQDQTWAWRYAVQIDFRGEYERTATLAFDLDSVVLAGPDPIEGRSNFAHLDLAVIRVRGDLSRFPAPLRLGTDADAMDAGQAVRHPIYVVGFPAKPEIILPGDGAGLAPPQPGSEYEVPLKLLFDNVFGVKRWMPGLVDAGTGQLAGDTRNWIMGHDASTLRGSSGSCVVDFEGENALVVGLHFGGQAREENWAHVLAALQPELAGLGIDWRAQY